MMPKENRRGGERHLKVYNLFIFFGLKGMTDYCANFSLYYKYHQAQDDGGVVKTTGLSKAQRTKESRGRTRKGSRRRRRKQKEVLS